MNIYLGGLYKEVEYIESSGTQWLDTGIIPTQNTKSQIKVLFKEFTGDVVYGMYTGDDNADYRLFNKYDSGINVGKCIYDFGSNRIMSGSTVFSENTAYELEIGNYYVKDLGTGTTLTSGTAVSSYTGSRTITLNNYNNSTYSKNRWYYVKIWDGSTLVRDMIPCYRLSDNEIGMFDKVNNQFYSNSGTGTFTKGNDVKTFQAEVKNIYIGEYGWKPGANTIAYYPLKTNGTEGSGKSGLDITTTGITFSDGVAVLDGNQRATIPNVTGYKTICFWYNENSSNTGMVLGNTTDKYIQLYNGVVYFKGTSSFNFTVNASKDARHLLTVTQTTANNSGASSTGNSLTLYIDGTLKGTQNNAYLDWSLYGMGWSGNSSYPYAFKGKVSELIVESSEWTQSEITAYYNQTKSNYGL